MSQSKHILTMYFLSSLSSSHDIRRRPTLNLFRLRHITFKECVKTLTSFGWKQCQLHSSRQVWTIVVPFLRLTRVSLELLLAWNSMWTYKLKSLFGKSFVDTSYLSLEFSRNNSIERIFSAQNLANILVKQKNVIFLEFSASSRAVLVQITPVLGVLVGVVVTLILIAICIVIFVKIKKKVRFFALSLISSTKSK